VGLSRIPNPLLAQAAKADKREQRLKLEQIPEAKRFSPSCCARRLAAVWRFLRGASCKGETVEKPAPAAEGFDQSLDAKTLAAVARELDSHSCDVRQLDRSTHLCPKCIRPLRTVVWSRAWMVALTSSRAALRPSDATNPTRPANSHLVENLSRLEPAGHRPRRRRISRRAWCPL